MLHFLAIHNGGMLKINRVSRPKISIPNPSLTIIGGIQPAILRQQLAVNPKYFHSGFMARFLVAMPPFEAVRDNDNEIEPAVLSAWEELLDCLIDNAEEAIQEDGGINPFVFSLTDEAKDVFQKYQHKHTDSQETESDGLGTIDGKFGTNALRIALILHCVELANRSGDGFDSCQKVQQKTMLAACQITEWFVNEAKRVFVELASV